MLALALVSYFSFTLAMAGLSKLDDPAYTRASFRTLQIFPSRYIPAIAKIFPIFEIILALFLVSGILPLIFSIINAALFAVFLGIKLYVYLRKLPVECGCFGSNYKAGIDKVTLAVILIQLILAVLLILKSYEIQTIEFSIRVFLFMGFFTLIAILSFKVYQRKQISNIH
jgi:hypothetical protein